MSTRAPGWTAAARKIRSAGALAALFACIAGLPAFGWLGGTDRAGGESDPANAHRPLPVHDGGYASSDACRSCHPREYDSWHRTFHRTMTQVVTPETVISDWWGTLTIRGRDYHLLREGDRYVVDMVDPEFGSRGRSKFRVGRGTNETERIRARALVSTGSHNQQIYWMGAGGDDRTLHLLPFTWLVAEQRWIPYEHSFLAPDADREYTVVWNEQCIRCHSTAGQPGTDVKTLAMDTKVAELGIACEACHGPGQTHVDANQGFFGGLRRYALHLTSRDDETIVHPGKLPADRSNAVCGQCHSVTSLKTLELSRQWWQTGYSYRPGDDLFATRALLERPAGRTPRDWLSRSDRHVGRKFYDDYTWSDGRIRTSGRDFTGIADSPCAATGELTCLSCHSMHESDPVDQIAGERESDAACLQCHPSFEGRTEHTHHTADSSGSRCQNCHMPHTTYGLFKAIRSHTIGDSPSLLESLEHRRPNACNLCHLDKSLAWTGRHLETWYGQAAPELASAEDETRSAALLWLLRGAAGQRALVAWHMGWGPALEASGREWIAPFLAEALRDPYSAVRFIAGRSLEKLPGYDDLGYDFVATPEHRGQKREAARARWRDAWTEAGSHEDPVRFLTRDGVDDAVVQGVIRRRDNRRVKIAE